MSYTSYFVVSQKITAKDIYDRETQRRSASDGPFDLAILTKIEFDFVDIAHDHLIHIFAFRRSTLPMKTNI